MFKLFPIWSTKITHLAASATKQKTSTNSAISGDEKKRLNCMFSTKSKDIPPKSWKLTLPGNLRISPFLKAYLNRWFSELPQLGLCSFPENIALSWVLSPNGQGGWDKKKHPPWPPVRHGMGLSSARVPSSWWILCFARSNNLAAILDGASSHRWFWGSKTLLI